MARIDIIHKKKTANKYTGESLTTPVIKGVQTWKKPIKPLIERIKIVNVSKDVVNLEFI